jgi:hypothetical protein
MEQGKQWYIESLHVSFSVAVSSILFVASADQPGRRS